MARTAGSGAYLSGIGTMLTQTDVCTACGRVHEDRLFRFRAQPSEECPAVLGAFPMMAGLGDAEAGVPAASAEFAAGDLEISYPVTVSPTPMPVTGRRSGLSIPWIMPSQSEEFL
ncbi:MAG: hypothetical protein L3K00_00335 [Thermoplasmata archaeon]|nr:hypothetical protein [Thermoplasmata archaeon]